MQNSLATRRVYWNGHVIVLDEPDAIDSAEACRPTHPTADDLTVRQRAVHVVETMNEGQLTLGRDVQVTYLVAEGAIKHSENFLPGSSFAVSPDIPQGRSDIE